MYLQWRSITAMRDIAGIRALSCPRTEIGLCAQGICAGCFIYCAMQVTVVQCQLILNKWHLGLIAVLKKWCLNVGWALPRWAAAITENFSIIDTDNLKNFLLIFYEMCNLNSNPFTFAIDVEFKLRKSVLGHAEPYRMRCVVERSGLAGVKDTHLCVGTITIWVNQSTLKYG